MIENRAQNTQRYRSNIRNDTNIQRNFVINRANSVRKHNEPVRNQQMQKLSKIVLQRARTVSVRLPAFENMHNINDDSLNLTCTPTPTLTPQASPTKSTMASSFIKHPGTIHDDSWLF